MTAIDLFVLAGAANCLLAILARATLAQVLRDGHAVLGYRRGERTDAAGRTAAGLPLPVPAAPIAMLREMTSPRSVRAGLRIPTHWV